MEWTYLAGENKTMDICQVPPQRLLCVMTHDAIDLGKKKDNIFPS